ncbi:MAG: bifunctional ornithine acetyltransferase/N-acetylglutamate synthase [Armatimonadetes bacterium 55-13]|nr:bifunctional glutamate N-acetyltransferase/amino-acid acetyltransferase ArgJ [Armatimonadota bacterium]OJU62746.1 MAG: bifunctional ornithine acetyltransferase/N-acetylglutamate synthase [Armatimonadetes bacterium 55-13]
MNVPKGFKFAGVRCGLKNKRNDIGLILSETPARAAGMFTTNQVRAACVDYSRTAIAKGVLRGVVVNSGNANCCTGEQGERDTAKMAELAATALGVQSDDLVVGSTGVIGQLLDMVKVEKGIAEAGTKLGEDPRPFMDAILTTDLVEKEAGTTVGNAAVYGVAKGSGMIAPNMATMLAYITTDADVEHLDLPAILKRANDKSFNCMTVDGDTSTNDMVIVLANGASGEKPSEADFEAALTEVLVSLAKQVARDGEGATKLVEVVVTGSSDPKKIARTIADSPLVKTAMFGCDPNWGRVLMAAGRAGVPFSKEETVLTIQANGEDHLLFENGAPAAFDPKRVSTALKSDYVVIDLKVGEGETATIYTCDFGYGYVRINAEYHT